VVVLLQTSASLIVSATVVPPLSLRRPAGFAASHVPLRRWFAASCIHRLSTACVSTDPLVVMAPSAGFSVVLTVANE
jgi:hypothetical protein